MNEAFEKILEMLEQRIAENTNEDMTYKIPYFGLDIAKKIVQEVAEEYNSGWIPIKTRPMTEEEKEYYSEFLVECKGFIYECHLPDDGQEVLVTSKHGSVDKTTFYTDCGNYFENYEDYDEVIAWQPLPEPFKERD